MFISRLLKASSIRLVSEFLGIDSFSGTSETILLITGIFWVGSFFIEPGTGFEFLACLVVSGVMSFILGISGESSSLAGEEGRVLFVVRGISFLF